MEYKQGKKEFFVCEEIPVGDPEDVYNVLKDTKYHNESQEHFLAVLLNGAHRIIDIVEVFKGTVNSCNVHPREFFKSAILASAASVIAVHNHPSGELVPSKDDLKVTERLKAAGEILGIRVLDHIIVAKTGYASIQ